MSNRIWNRSVVTLAAGVVLCAAVGSAPVLAQTELHEVAWLSAPDGASYDDFGISVAIDGNTALIGSCYNDHDGLTDTGAAYVFLRVAGEWMWEATLTASDAAAGDRFGFGVAVDGDTAIVGAANGQPAGAAYVFVRNGGVWTQRAKLTASDPAVGCSLGVRAALDGDTAVVTAWTIDAAGAVYVFEKPVAGWHDMTETAKLTASDAQENDYFGHGVTIDGDTVVCGANGDDHTGTNGGSAYAFVKPPGGWEDTHENTKLTPSDPLSDKFFGESVSMASDMLVVGAPGTLGGTDGGSAYVFLRDPNGWIQAAKLTASDAAPYDRFGVSVAVAGDTVVAGAYYDGHAGGTEAGSAYVFAKPPGGWHNMTETAKLTASDAAPYDYFGQSVAIANGTALIGACVDDHDGLTDVRSAYVFDLFGPGDMNCDGLVNFADINPFVLALSDHDAYVAQFPDCDYYHADCNGNGYVDFADINPFVALLSGG